MFLAKLGSLNDVKIKPPVFSHRQVVQEDLLKSLKLATTLVACIYDNLITIWNLDSNKFVTTLFGHSKNITCLETIDENRFASGSYDRTIKIWDANKFVCLKTLAVHLFGVESLKMLPSNRLASGSFDFDADIKIWNIESGECLQTLYGSSDGINGIVIYLPYPYILSCSNDSTIKVWDLTRGGEYIQALTGHSSWVFCLFLLRNDQLASGSKDNTIKIWDISLYQDSSRAFKLGLAIRTTRKWRTR